ncbi:MAG TPA: T9SS type A sorting domain-containing protein [Flavobacterium sp.]|nr:T9SS type A sorting domain-containing protein [Flavobacterium sp.]
MMKKYIYIICFSCLLGSGLQAQVLWSDDFDSYTTGNVGTINSLSGQSNVSPNPAVAGQGEWFVIETYSATGSYTNSFEARIEPEPGRGNVLTLEDIPQTASSSFNISLFKAVGNEKPEGGIESLWHERDTGNDILKFEYDFYTGNLGTTPSPDQSGSGIGLSKAKNSGFNFTADLAHMMSSRYLTMPSANLIRNLSFFKEIPNIENKVFGQLSDSTWVTVIMYIDYATGYLYMEVPSMNKAVRSANPVPLTPVQGMVLEPIDHISIGLSTNVLSGNGNRNPYFVKYDNLKMSAVNTLPLSLKKLAATKFTIFPNPVTEIVTITNSDNIGVEQIEIFDISGKNIKTQSFNNENEVQLNLGDFASGTYLLHIKTNAGTAVEKVVKK